MDITTKSSTSKFLSVIGTFCFVLLLFSNCSKPETKSKAEDDNSNTISKAFFGKINDSTSADIYTFSNTNNVKVSITNFGGIIVSIVVPDKKGTFADITLGFDSLNGYLKPHPYFGAIIGRFGNRIAKGKFELNGQTYNLALNNNGNTLHGGLKGFDKVLWKAEIITNENNVPSLKLSYTSPDMEEGYPGNLQTEVIYTLTNENQLIMQYKAITDKPTVLNLTNHAYFNLSGTSSDILQHELTINADKFVPIDENSIPFGELKDVATSPFDFKISKTIGKEIDANDVQLKNGNGYDHTWVINKSKDSLTLAATAFDPSTNRILNVYTTEPGVQFYTGNFLDGSITGKNGNLYSRRNGFCLETQHFPDSPNQPNFPSVELNPGQTFNSTTIYEFSVKP